jgi:hypothetical protein
MTGYLTGHAALLSQWVNHALLYPWGGHHDMTVSAHVYTKRHLPRWRVAYATINAVFFWQYDHCWGSFQRDVGFCERLPTTED